MKVNGESVKVKWRVSEIKQSHGKDPNIFNLKSVPISKLVKSISDLLM